MQLLQRASYSSLVGNPLLIFCGFSVFVQLIHSVYITSCVNDCYANVATFWITTWSIAGGAGSYPLLLTFLCIKFSGTNSMSVPRGNFKKLHNRLNPAPTTKASFSSKKKSHKYRRKVDRKEKRRKTHGLPVAAKNGNNKLSKPKPNFNLDIATTDAFSSIPATTDHVGVTNHVNSTIIAQDPNLLSHQHKGRKDKRKSGRRGKNTNEFLTSNPSPSSSGASILLKRIARMNQNEGEAVRKKILEKVEELDPLMCLPKVLCGYTSRRRHNKYHPLKTTTTTTTSSTTRRPILAAGIIDEYLHLLGIIPPINDENDGTGAEKIVKWNDNKSPKDVEKLEDNKKQKKKKSGDEETGDDDKQESESASSSGESDESAGYERYPTGRPHRDRFLFNRNRDKNNEENEIDEEDDESGEEDEDDEVDDLLDDEDVKYIVEKAKMEKLMGTSGSHSEENWWDPFDEEKIYQKTMSSYYLPPPDPSYDPLANEDILGNNSNDGGGITRWFSNMFSNIMPSISWGGKRDDDDFKSDPFFTSFDGRSMKNGESPSFSRSNNFNYLKLPSLSSPHYQIRDRSGKRIDEENYFGGRLNSGQLDYTSGNDQEDPLAKYHIAVEIGNRAVDPDQCDFIYNGCPLNYEEILAIINEPLRFEPSTRFPQKPSTTTTAAATGNENMSHKFIPPPLPQRQIVVPLHQQQRFPFQTPPPPPPPAQTLFLQQPHHYTLPHQHSSSPMQHYTPQFQQHQHSSSPMQIYNPQFQQHQQLSQLQPIPQNYHQFLHQHYPALLSTADGIMAQLVNTNTPQHKTQIHQTLPNGQVEINLNYSAEKEQKQPQGFGVVSNNLYVAPAMNTGGETLYTHYPHHVSSHSSSYEHSHLTDPFNHKVLNYEFFPSSNGYKIRRRNEKMEKSVPNKDVKVVSYTTKKGVSFSGNSSFKNDTNIKVRRPSPPEKSSKKRKEVGIPSRGVTFNNKGKYKRKQMSEDTFPPSTSAPPLRQSSHRQSILPQQQASQDKRKKKMNRNNNKKSIIKEKYVKKQQNKRSKKKKRIQNDDNSSSSSSSGSSSSSSNNSGDDGISSSSSNEQLEQHGKEQVARKEYLDDMKAQRKRMKRRRKLHLHKQSSESIEAKKRRKIAAPNAIYPVYGHPFPPPYAGYYHTLHPSTPTSPSFFSYFFGR